MPMLFIARRKVLNGNWIIVAPIVPPTTIMAAVGCRICEILPPSMALPAKIIPTPMTRPRIVPRSIRYLRDPGGSDAGRSLRRSCLAAMPSRTAFDGGWARSPISLRKVTIRSITSSSVSRTITLSPPRSESVVSGVTSIHVMRSGLTAITCPLSRESRTIRAPPTQFRGHPLGPPSGSASVQPLALQHLDERRTIQAEELRRLVLVPTGAREGLADEIVFESFDGRAQIEPRGRQLGAGTTFAPHTAHARRQVARLDDVGGAKKNGPLDRILELAHVAGPTVRQKELRCRGRDFELVAAE